MPRPALPAAVPPLRRALAGLCTLLVLGALLAGLPTTPARAGSARRPNPNVLWHIVHDRCVPDLRQFHTPLPCIAVHPRAGYALLKDLDGRTQVLLIPTARVTGIEDPAVRAPGAPDYLALAWANRGTVRALAGRALAREAIALAVNSIAGRTQNQLHIHLDCIRPDVAATIAAQLGAVGTRFAPFPAPLPGGPYLARRLDTLSLVGINPFRLLAAEVPGAAAAMGRWSLGLVPVVLPSHAAPGFVLLASETDPARHHVAAAERLQDHTCALAGARSGGG